MRSNNPIIQLLSKPFNYVSDKWEEHKRESALSQIDMAGNDAAINYITDVIFGMNEAFKVDARAPRMVLAGQVMEGKPANHITAELSDFYAPLLDTKDEHQKYGHAMDDEAQQIWAVFKMSTAQHKSYPDGMNATDYSHFFEAIGFDRSEKIDNALNDKQKTEAENDYQSAEGWFGHMKVSNVSPGQEHGGQFKVAVPLPTLLDRLGIEGESYDRLMDIVHDAKHNKAVELGFDDTPDTLTSEL